EIRSFCYAVWTAEPVAAQSALKAISALSEFNTDKEIGAIKLWVGGIAEITRGHFELAAGSLDKAAATLRSVGRKNEAAQTQVAKLIALAMVGDYDDAIHAGHRALREFVREGDHLSAGKIEMNMSNIMSRRGRHRDAEKLIISARKRFVRVNELAWATMAENDLAITY